MKTSHIGMALGLSLAVLAPSAGAQQVAAEVIVGSGPVSGRVIVGDPYYRAPRVIYRERVVVERRYAPRVIIVERKHHPRGGWHRHGFRTIRVYYDYGRDLYLDRYDARYDGYRGGLREVVVYERDGHYYQDWDRRHDD